MSQLHGTSGTTGTSGTSGSLTVEQVIHGFHQFLQYSLAQAKFEKIVDEETLASAEADVMICGPALCLYFAALRSNTTPPSCPIPGSARGSPPLILSNETCPPLFLSYFKLWQNTVPEIQALQPTYQHDLARIICDNAPLTQPTSAQLHRISADIRSVAIEISQRRTFQDRYRHDLQAALDVGQPTTGEKRRIASFQPPPSYEESSEPSHSPVPSVHSSPQGSPRSHGSLPPSPRAQTFAPPSSPPPTQGGLLTAPGRSFGPPPGPPPGTVAGGSGSQRPAQGHGRTRSDTLADVPAIDLIRETLYAALADVISTTPSIRSLLKSDPPRAYFSAVALAVLGVCRNSVTPTGTVISVVGRELILQECPVAYRPLMTEFVGISSRAKQFELEDDQRAIRAVQRGKEPEEPRLDRLRRMLEAGVAGEEARYDREGPTPPRPPPKDRDPVSGPVGTAGHYRCRSAAASTSNITAGTPPVGRPASSPRTSSESTHGKAANLLRKSPRSQNGHLPRPVSPALPMTPSYIQPVPSCRSAEQEEAQPRRSEEGTTIQLANRVNALALKMTELKLFRERSDMIFAILQSVS